MKRVLLAMIVAMVAGPAAAAQAVALPPGFADEAVTSVAVPTALAFTPAGDMLVTTQSGTLRVRTPSGVTTTALTLGSRVWANSERGLLGVAVDPAFAINGFVYLYYTFNKFGTCPSSGGLTPVNRVSRLRITGGIADPASETVLVDNMPSAAGNHNGGDLQVGQRRRRRLRLRGRQRLRRVQGRRPRPARPARQARRPTPCPTRALRSRRSAAVSFHARTCECLRPPAAGVGCRPRWPRHAERVYKPSGAGNGQDVAPRPAASVAAGRAR